MVIQTVIEELKRETGLSGEHVVEDVEVPPKVSMGDYAFPCFSLAERRGESPAVIAEDLASSLEHDAFSDVSAQGPYVNVTLTGSAKIEASKDDVEKDGGDTIIVEFPAPNTNKPLHLGHALNMAIGQSTTNILRGLGHDVVVENLYNDRGIHISKSMLAYQKEGDGETPSDAEKKPDHFVGEYYVRYGELVEDDASLEDEAQQMLQAWEDGDEEVRSLWKTMRDWCLEGIRETIEDYGVDIDQERFESEIYEDGRDIAMDGLRRGVFERDESGAVVADLEDDGLGTKHVLRADGTSIYMTQDLGLARHRADEHSPDRIVHVVGNEQEYHFRCLFAILDRLGFDFAGDVHHLSYGMLRLAEGTMSSREGTAIHADTIRDEMIGLAGAEIRDRYDGLDEEEVRSRAETIGMAALKYYLLRTDPKRDVTFDSEESLSFTGETGPYIQYTYARIQSVLRKAQSMDAADHDVLRSEEERRVLRRLIQYEDELRRAARTYNPSVIANYVLDVAQAFNKFYHEHQILVDDRALRGARLDLCRVTARRLKEGLELLGIGVVEEM